MVNIEVTGPDKSGKGHVIAAITHALQQLGCDVTVQLGETHNAKKLAMADDQLQTKLTGLAVRITEQQTSN
jgi:hypothetical protein